MKKFLIFSFVLFSSVCSFGGHVKVFSWSSDGSTSNVVTFSRFSSSDFAIPFYNNTFGFILRGNDSQATLFLPSPDSSVVTNRYGDISHPISFDDSTSPGNNTVWYSISSSSDLLRLFTFSRSVVVSGYSGKGLVYLNPSDGIFNRRYNFDYKIVVGELLCSTNNLYRSLVLSHLSSISSSVSSISSDVSSLPRLIDLYSEVNFFHTSNISNLLDYASSQSIISGEQRNFFLNRLSDLSSDPQSYSLYSDNLRNVLSSLSNLHGLSSVAAGNPDVKYDLRDLGNFFNGSLNEALTGSSSGVGSGGIAGDVKRLATNDWASVVTNQLAKNSQASKDQLKSNHDSITNQLSHMFDDNPNSVGRAIRSTANNTANSADGVSAIAAKLNSTLHVQIDNPNNIGVILDGPVTIDTTQFNGVSVPLSGLKDKIDTWYNDWYSFWDISTPAYSWDNFYNMVQDFKNQNHSDISSLTNSINFQLSNLSNFLASIDTQLKLAFPELTNDLDNATSSFHALLLDDYADYITNRFYSSAVDTFRDDYPSVYTNLVKFGLSTEDGKGNFWSLFSSTLFYQSALVCGMLEDLSTVRKFAEDHIEGGFQGGVTSLIDKFPSPSQLEDYLNQASNHVLRIEASSDDFKTAYSYMTNSSVNAFSPFHGIFSSVPDNLVFFKTGNEKYITIPVSRGGNAWLVIRLCFSFSIAAVNVILFPKFVLMVIALLSKLSKRFVKFVPTDR